MQDRPPSIEHKKFPKPSRLYGRAGAGVCAGARE
nr:MAG TPA: hypothetical protein [Caudoviricetes sp.]